MAGLCKPLEGKSYCRSLQNKMEQKNLYIGEGNMKERDMESARKQLLLHISEILAQRGLISEEEKLRMRDQIIAPAAE